MGIKWEATPGSCSLFSSCPYHDVYMRSQQLAGHPQRKSIGTKSFPSVQTIDFTWLDSAILFSDISLLYWLCELLEGIVQEFRCLLINETLLI